MTMAEAAVESSPVVAGGRDKAHNNNHPLAANHNRPVPASATTKQRKRKRLSQVLDKLAGHATVASPAVSPDNPATASVITNSTASVTTTTTTTVNNNVLPAHHRRLHQHHHHNNNNNDEEEDEEDSKSLVQDERALKTPKHMVSSRTREVPSDVFRFDSLDQERYHQQQQPGSTISEEEEVEDVFSPAGSSNKSPHSSTDSPRISFSPLRLKDSGNDDEVSSSPPLPPPPRVPPCACFHCATGLGHQQAPAPLPTALHPYDRFFPASPVSPLTPVSPAPPVYSFEHYLHTKYLPDIFRRRSHSDSDLPLWFEATKAERGSTPTAWPHPLTLRPPQTHAHHSPTSKGSVDSETNSPQESPLDLSMKSCLAAAAAAAAAVPPPLQLLPAGFLPARGAVSVPVVKGDVASPTTKESVASRYNLEVSPVVEEMPPGSDVAYVCPVCGQMFSLHDRLAKHMASRHKSRATGSGEPTAKAYLCEVCKRSFARSDMLTRHMRLHTGVKPYTCRVCGQVFSRSDHLSTHQRTHTGEKPYKCPQCPYAACRRDMITRHMRTHARYEPTNAASAAIATIKTE